MSALQPAVYGMSPRKQTWCVACGWITYGQAKDNLKVCPNSKCRVPFILTDGKFDDNGWGRCLAVDCVSFMKANFRFCQSCGLDNKTRREEIRKREDERKMRQLEEEKDNMTAEIAKMKLETEALRAQLQALQEKKESQDTEGVAKTGFIVGPEDIPAEVSEIAEAMIKTVSGKSLDAQVE